MSAPDRPPGRGATPAPASRPAPRRPAAGADGTVAIGSALSKVLAMRGMEDALVLGQVLEHWEEVVGPDVAAQVQPRLVRDGELVVLAGHPAWSTELEMAAPAVLSGLAERLGDRAPTRLTVRIGGAAQR